MNILKCNQLVNARIYHETNCKCGCCGSGNLAFMFTVKDKNGVNLEECSACAVENTDDGIFINGLKSEMEIMLKSRKRHEELLDWYISYDKEDLWELLGVEADEHDSETCEVDGAKCNVWFRSCDAKWIAYINYPRKEIQLPESFCNKDNAKRAVFDYLNQKKLYAMIIRYSKSKRRKSNKK